MTPSTSTATVSFKLNVALLQAIGELRYSTNHDIALVRFEDCNETNKALVAVRLSAVMLNVTNNTLVTNAIVTWNTTNTQLLPFAISENQVRHYQDIVVGSDILTFGFPTSITMDPVNPEIDPSTPLLRKGIVAGKNAARGTIILDSPAYFGDSGCPVFLRENSFQSIGYYLIGIQTQFVPFIETWINTKVKYVNHNISNSGYSVSEPMDEVLKMVWQ